MDFNNEPTYHSDDEGEPEDEDEDDEDEEEDDDREDDDDDSSAGNEEDDTREEHNKDDEDTEVQKENGITGTTNSPEKARSPVRRRSRDVQLSFIVQCLIFPTYPPLQAEIQSFLSCPTVEKLLQPGDLRSTLELQVRMSSISVRPLLARKFFKTLFLLLQVDASNTTEAVEIFLKVSSLYSGDPETKAAVLETIGNV